MKYDMKGLVCSCLTLLTLCLLHISLASRQLTKSHFLLQVLYVDSATYMKVQKVYLPHRSPKPRGILPGACSGTPNQRLLQLRWTGRPEECTIHTHTKKKSHFICAIIWVDIGRLWTPKHPLERTVLPTYKKIAKKAEPLRYLYLLAVNWLKPHGIFNKFIPHLRLLSFFTVTIAVTATVKQLWPDTGTLTCTSMVSNTVEPLYKDTPEMQTSRLIRTLSVVPAT